jgi:tellurite resistance protein
MAELSETPPRPCFTRARWIAQAPVPLFAITMGHAGLGLAWRSAHRAFGLPATVAEALMAFAAGRKGRIGRPMARGSEDRGVARPA